MSRRRHETDRNHDAAAFPPAGEARANSMPYRPGRISGRGGALGGKRPGLIGVTGVGVGRVVGGVVTGRGAGKLGMGLFLVIAVPLHRAAAV